mmetsp:Transcript_30662/g.59946  ORF Transcript_30662/g.59946 Transcript_30662/m.59946 type:complete len:210 (+) Transcript_30662:70-699(+)|eukprot:CAMPEP_0173384726 /NCGR_PEP_ID=MMETSP1356-20130122/7302_1 /TAXON_ID=77927 ORGANISM="Hemiselmis virescens, Strain PCC157" /NCGR_SAMPLE_ID=MMETSP1356 /ASSEMBLY_ACC=CAM_ASM_000847 /LENGTH=209 /DNA_ID=CAMNT_0014340229 /DNA_START=33 /DNA_END=662 /DNA_ORIENTATION=-
MTTAVKMMMETNAGAPQLAPTPASNTRGGQAKDTAALQAQTLEMIKTVKIGGNFLGFDNGKTQMSSGILERNSPRNVAAEIVAQRAAIGGLNPDEVVSDWSMIISEELAQMQNDDLRMHSRKMREMNAEKAIEQAEQALDEACAFLSISSIDAMCGNAEVNDFSIHMDRLDEPAPTKEEICAERMAKRYAKKWTLSNSRCKNRDKMVCG